MMMTTAQSPGSTGHGNVELRQIDHSSLRARSAVVDLLGDYLQTLGVTDHPCVRYQWLYRQNPHGQARTFLAYSGDRPVAMTSLFPRKVVVDGEVRLGAIGGDAFVRPEFRRRGIATALHDMALASMGEGTVEFMYGPPEPRNLKALQKAGAVVTGTVQRFVRPMSRNALSSLQRGAIGRVLEPLAGVIDNLLRVPRSHVELRELGPRPDPGVDRAFELLLGDRDSEEQVTPVRDAAYVAWRYGISPTGLQTAFLLADRGKPVGMASLERWGSRVAIVDFWAPRRHRSAALLSVLSSCRPADSVDFQAFEPELRSMLQLTGVGFIRRGRGKAFQVQCPQGSSLFSSLAGDGVSWLYTRGDGDVDHVLV